jgi:hypothetical protein
MAEEIIVNNARVRQNDGPVVRIFDLVALGLTHWDGMRVRVNPMGTPPWTDVELDAINFSSIVEDSDDQNGSTWVLRETFTFDSAAETTTGPRDYKRFVRCTVNNNGPDARLTLARILPG